LLERGGFGKGLNKVPAAACWDYEEIPRGDKECSSEVGALESPKGWITKKSPLVDVNKRNKANKINL
jgi:hypothetical protein